MQAAAPANAEDADYPAYLQRVNARFRANTQGRPVFTTAAQGLWDTYLSSFPEAARQYRNCAACRRFIERYGALVTIDADGTARSAMWSPQDAPGFYKPALSAMAAAAERAPVSGVFLASHETLGTPVAGGWQHLHAANPAPFSAVLRTPAQAMAEKREDYRNVQRALEEFTPATVRQAVKLLESEALYRAEKVIGPAKWLQQLHAARRGRHGQQRANVVWLAVATAPAGFAHPRSAMVGTLLEDIAAGKSFTDVSRAFAAKMRPDVYLRPQAAPAAGNIAAAEKAFAAMGLAPSLERRFARLDEVLALWRPAAGQRIAPAGGGIFGHLQPRRSTPAPGLELPAQTMTWEKFQRVVLPQALGIELHVPSHGNFCALVTAVHEDAPPILQWDRADRRNTVSIYVYTNGSPASQWGLREGCVPVTAVCLQPSMWNGGQEHQGRSVVVLLEGARDSMDAGNALFPETIRSELHPFRAVIEAYSRGATLAGREEASACGYVLSEGQAWNQRLRVRTEDGLREYVLDRWD